ncbi:MAG: AmmeMemoRadiSam system radical SAM enzyme [bacterium]|nr:AmmeMemoRadiSam system radical SAM enzyme [bacterium]
MKKECDICFHACRLDEGEIGFCRARGNEDGEIHCLNYGQLTALALDPIEKKPLNRFYPGSRILSVGSYGCNLRCPFCQNHEISMMGEERPETESESSGQRVHGGRSQETGGVVQEYFSPEDLVALALRLRQQGNIGIAYTYNEPLISYEYVYDCARLAHEAGLKNVLVTNGTVNEAPRQRLLPYIDALNIDLKGIRPEYYRLLGGSLEVVKRTIEVMTGCCHVEITTLIVPGQNDTEQEMRELASYLAGIDPDLPLHVSRFFPRYHMQDTEATPVRTIYRLAEVAREYLRYVYEGNC